MEASEYLMPDKEAPDKASKIVIVHFFDSQTKQIASLLQLPSYVRLVLQRCVSHLDIWEESVIQIHCTETNQKTKVSTAPYIISNLDEYSFTISVKNGNVDVRRRYVSSSFVMKPLGRTL